MSATRPAPAAGSSRAATAPAPSPPPYAPMCHPGTPGRWTDEAILRALRAWAEEMGRPPRRQEWTGERPGDAPPGQRKWMREHPYWPSSSCVADHFGSWTKALHAAGLIKRAFDPDDSVGGRVETAWRMRDRGYAVAAIADRLSVSRSTVHNYLRAGRCPQCGGPVVSPRAERCLACTAAEPTIPSTWSRDAIKQAIRAWTADRGRAPSYHEWTPSRSFPGAWEAESPRWPSAAVVCAAYDEFRNPWNAALADAGASLRFQRWSDEAIRAALAEFWMRTGRAPAPEDLRTTDWPGPTTRTLRRRYGSLERAWSTLGPVPAT